MILGAVFGRSDSADPKPEKCLTLVRELNDYVLAHHNTCLCPEIVKDFDFTSPERKDYCAGLMFDVLQAFAIIMERECGIIIH